MITDEDRQEIVKLRIEEAYNTMKEAQLLIDNSFWNAAINRMYYACYYAATALLIKNGIEAQTHAGVRQMLGLHFIRTGKLTVELGNYYSNLFAKRQSGDYDVYIFFDKNTVETIYPQANEFIAGIVNLISV
ncbi:uncharacterized protein (UPF0332 family) [Parabacteroides sp. PFB2-12]|uniref:HEPN domain-containing protein n=1 Tax=unclassified Parabacteroides TaxID=2649774 RepID=UPI002475CBEB|nr:MULTISPECIES: HEPN domain-containing protein [unclassified Parabacteroides]MDH6342582.1 uncharacterized protein (UPF0332 family) [Parabacteroides sp. PM6-13]MDH6390234.1 uncharacterized protein (UPF0332 family) [Parabacteroides sp. PFB2-12]